MKKVAKDESIEEKKIEEKEELINNYDEISKKGNGKRILFSIILLVIILSALFLYLIKTDKLNFGKKENKEVKNTKKIELKHTDPVTVKSEGVYITDVSDVVDMVMPSIVSITSKTIINSGKYGPSYYYYFGRSGSYTTEGAGSGVIVAGDDSNLYVLTNYHVVQNTDELSVKFIDDESYDAKVKGVSERKDVAIVAVDKKAIKESTLKAVKIATLGNSDELKVGNGIIAIGNALGYGQSVTTGVVSALNREVSTDSYVQDMIQIDAAINGGNSGGALLNSRGEVVGINTAKYSSNSSITSASVEGMGFAIPISNVESVIETLINGKDDDSNVTLGIEGYMTNESGFSGYGLPEGFYISKIVEGSGADKAGLEIGNIITEIDDNKVTSIDIIRKVLNKKEKDDTVKIKVKYASRNEYKEKDLEIKLS